MRISNNRQKYQKIKNILIIIIGTTLTLTSIFALAISFFSITRAISKSVDATNAKINTLPLEGQGNFAKKSGEAYELLNGWNLIAFPLIPESFSTAAELIESISLSGGYATTVSSWDGDRWQEYVRRGTEEYGDDYPIEPGKAYFIRNHKKTSWMVIGKALSESQQRQYALNKGWNAVGFSTPNFYAKDILKNINQSQASQEAVNEIDWWQSGSWDVYVFRTYEDRLQKEYGNNFQIDVTKGYMVKANQDVFWEVPNE